LEKIILWEKVGRYEGFRGISTYSYNIGLQLHLSYLIPIENNDKVCACSFLHANFHITLLQQHKHGVYLDSSMPSCIDNYWPLHTA
jgi:hypothetical protein